jgi:2-iminobutanoate/2-iminopropanoate deaminase
MNKKQIFHPEQKDKGFVIGAFSDAVSIDGWVYLSGQGPVDFSKGTFISGTIEEETRQTLHNISCILEAAGCTMNDVIKCSVHLSDIKDWDRFNKVYADYFKGVRPARIAVQSALGFGIKIEIDAVARIP